MKYFVIASANGNLDINSISEWSDLNSAKIAYHNLCKNYWAATDVIVGYVAILDSELSVVNGYRECISHPAPETEQTE